MSAPAVIPAFDPGSPDAAILAAYEQVRAHKAWVYPQEDVNHGNWPEGEVERMDAEQMAAEEAVYASTAKTIPGVVARLLLLVPHIDSSRWIDRGLVEHGFLALYEDRDGIDGQAVEVMRAVRDMLTIEWEQALSRYEQSYRDFAQALKLKGIIDRERFRLRSEGQQPSDFLNELEAFSDENEDRFSNGAEIRRLFATLAPTAAAYLRKASIAVAEGCQEEATLWLARDMLFLSGRIARDAATDTGGSDA